MHLCSAPALAALLGAVAATASVASRLPAVADRESFPHHSAPSVIEVPLQSVAGAPLSTTSMSGIVPSTGRNYTAYFAYLQDPSRFSYELRADGCVNKSTTLATSDLFGCELATNAGFFNMAAAGGCESDLVINGTVANWATGSDDGHAGFGVLATSTPTAVVGFITKASRSRYPLRTFSSGAGWIVRGGQDNVNASSDLVPNSTFVLEKAPRTAVGVTANGTLIAAVVDGVEDTKLGLDLHEWAEVLILHGAYHAVNLDGGGSSTAVLRGALWNRATCDDTGRICQRNVTSILCMTPPRGGGERAALRDAFCLACA